MRNSNPLLIVVILFLLYRFIIKDDTKKEIKDALINKELDKEKLSYPTSQYYSFADSLVSAMENATTDEDTIYSIFRKLKNNADYLFLQKAFGRRTYTGELFGGLTGLIDPSEGDTLEQWLHHELDYDEIKKVNEILRLRDIKYRI
jgi:hypothetical protein